MYFLKFIHFKRRDMFGMGFFEICMVLVIAVIFLGPDKLPKAMVDLAKFFKTIKKTMDEAKSSLDEELKLQELKQEALEYKNSITQGLDNISKDSGVNELNHIFDSTPKPSAEEKQSIQDELNAQSLQDKAQSLSVAPKENAQEIGYKKES